MNNHRKPPPARHGRSAPRAPLATLSGILNEMAKVYRRMKAAELPHNEGRSLVWVLGQMRAAAEALELERLHGRLDEMDTTITLESPNGYIARQVSPARVEDRRA